MKKNNRPPIPKPATKNTVAFKNTEEQRTLAYRYLMQKQFTQAISSYQAILKDEPNHVESLLNLSIAQCELQQFAESVKNCQRAVQLQPKNSQLQRNLANILNRQGQYAQAAVCYQTLIGLNPTDAEAYALLAGMLYHQNQFDAAIEQCQHALKYQPSCALAYHHLGLVLEKQGDFDAAKQYYLQALEIQPDYAEVQHNLSLILLSLGNYTEGWQRYEYRRHLSNPKTRIVSPPFEFPEWQGETLRRKSIIIWTEQGLGDEIQFSRYVQVLKKLGAKEINFICKKELQPLFQRLKGIDAVISLTEVKVVPPHDYWTLLISLPLRCQTTLKTIPARIPYLSANRQLMKKIALDLQNIKEFKIGVCWKGNIAYLNDSNRSPGIEAFQGLFQLSGVKFFALQPNMRAELLQAAGTNAVDRGAEIGAEDFEEAAALIMNLDLIISCDTAICHLAGALGKPVWILLPFIADWRWLMNRNDSPWYPTATLFRQQQVGNWTEVFERVGIELQKTIATPNRKTSWIHKITKLFRNYSALKCTLKSSSYKNRP